MRAVKAKSKVPYFDYTAMVDVDVQIDPDELHDGGWHHESECDHYPPNPMQDPERAVFTVAILSLHRQAHPRQQPDPLFCHELPCREIPCDLLRGAS